MTINDAGLALIKRHEGLRLDSYRDSVGIATVGYGHTGPDVRIPMTVTPGEADRLLQDDLARFENGVSNCLCGCPTNSDQFSAMVSLAYNIGLGNYATSTVLKRHRAGQYAGAANAFLLWKKAGGKVLPGLVSRREDERALYLGELA
jgi:lysozyme